MKYKILMALMIVSLAFIPLSCQQQEIPPQNWTVSNEAEFLAKCEHCNITFEKYEFGDGNVYYYQRMIGNATVMSDYINFQFDSNGTFVKKLSNWNYDLPSTLPPIISEKEAKTIGGGTKAELLYISGGPVFPTINTTDPCWAVSVYDSEGWNIDIVVVDAVTGEVLGHGAPVP